ncbi:MAG: DUF1614 domain-containing protein [Nitrospirae bacterium]|nr:MAG: DUF1614 domain-containing protein [Nitrospirota bacterium]
MPQLGCLFLLLIVTLIVLLPFLFAQIFVTALAKLRLAPDTALLMVMGIFLGSAINIPITKIARHEDVVMHPLAMFGMMHWLPQLRRIKRETIIAVNVGGCLIPASLALYETLQLLAVSGSYLFILAISVGINTVVCYWFAQPVEGIGIAMPAFLPPLVAASSALLLAPEEAPAVAFVAGVLGPLIGADLLHLRDIPRIATGMASIGGAGTFDGIVLSGVLAAYLA